MALKNKTITKKKQKKTKRNNIINGIAHVHATFNNTIISISDQEGNILAWSSAGKIGFKGSKKSTPYAAKLVAEKVGKTVLEQGVKNLEIEIKGPGPGRDSAIRNLQAIGFNITTINDVTPIPHNGPRPPKKPRG